MNANKEDQIYDVVIIGAGISGSNAAYTLKKHCQSLKILIVEAKDRVGGRTLTVDLKTASGKSRYDIGGKIMQGSKVYL